MNDSRRVWAPQLFFWTGLLAAGAFCYFAFRHLPYYLLPPFQRPEHPQHEFLRSSGYAGLTFGAIGTLLILLNLSYLVRKELVTFHWLGSLRSWMSFHVATGFTAYLLILLHADFLLRSALGSLALVGFTIVIVTGVLGRYIYAHTPRSLEGTELEIDEVRSHLKAYRADLERLGMPPELFQTVLESARTTVEEKSIAASLLAMVLGDRKLRQTYAKLAQVVRQSPKLRPLSGQILPLAQRYYKELDWLSRFHELRGLMSGWRFFHRWLAIVMVAAVLFHVLVAQKMGHLWLFDRAALQEYGCRVISQAFCPH